MIRKRWQKSNSNFRLYRSSKTLLLKCYIIDWWNGGRLWCFTPLSTIFQLYVAVSFIDGENRKNYRWWVKWVKINKRKWYIKKSGNDMPKSANVKRRLFHIRLWTFTGLMILNDSQNVEFNYSQNVELNYCHNVKFEVFFFF